MADWFTSNGYVRPTLPSASGPIASPMPVGSPVRYGGFSGLVAQMPGGADLLAQAPPRYAGGFTNLIAKLPEGPQMLASRGIFPQPNPYAAQNGGPFGGLPSGMDWKSFWARNDQNTAHLQPPSGGPLTSAPPPPDPMWSGAQKDAYAKQYGGSWNGSHYVPGAAPQAAGPSGWATVAQGANYAASPFGGKPTLLADILGLGSGKLGQIAQGFQQAAQLMRAPDGSTQMVPQQHVAHYTSLGAQPVTGSSYGSAPTQFGGGY